MPQLVIHKYSTYISVPGNRDGSVADGFGDIRSVLDQLREMDFNPRQKRWYLKNRYYAYDIDLCAFLLPVHCLDELRACLKLQEVEIVVLQQAPVETTSVEMSMNPSWKDRVEHGEPIAHLTHTESAMRACDLQTGKGKSVTLDTPVRIIGGWKLMRDIHVGDQVISQDGTPTTVDGVYPQGLLQVMRVTFQDGRFVDCSRDHLWKIYLNHGTYVVSTSVICDLMRAGHQVSIDLVVPESYFPREENLDEIVQVCLGEQDIADEYLEGSNCLRYVLFDKFIQSVHVGADKELLAQKLVYLGRSLGLVCEAIYDPQHMTYRFNIHEPVDRKLRIFSIDCVGSQAMQCISVSHPSRLYVVKDFIVTHNTYCAIRAITNLANPTLVICDGLVDQWKKEFLEKTTIPEDDIYLIRGAPSLVKLFKHKLQPKIFVASIDTLRPYMVGCNAPYNVIPSYPKFLEHFQIGIKVVDEFHLNFGTLVSIDLRSNVKHNLYLSATPKRSSKQEKKIFDFVFPPKIISGGGEYDKYVNVTFYRYRLELNNQNHFKTIHGYSHAKYESYITNNNLVRQRFMFSVIFPLINSHFVHVRTTGQKLLIFCHTVLFCEVMRDYVAGHFPTMDVRTYTQADPESNLEEADIIISTPKSCGTGKDIANLRTVIQTCSIGSEPLVEQILGRLRKLKNGDTPEYVDIFNTALGFHMGHYRRRSNVYKAKALTYKEHELI